MNFEVDFACKDFKLTFCSACWSLELELLTHKNVFDTRTLSELKDSNINRSICCFL